MNNEDKIEIIIDGLYDSVFHFLMPKETLTDMFTGVSESTGTYILQLEFNSPEPIENWTEAK